MTIDAKQIRAARALLNWSRDDLAEKADVSVPALARAEAGESQLRVASVNKIKSALEQAGVIFTDGHGVKLRTDIVRIFEGYEGIEAFYRLIYQTALETQKEFLQFGLRYKDIQLFHKGINSTEYLNSMTKLGRKVFRCIVSEEERNLEKTSYTKYRYWTPDKFLGVPFYVFGNNLAIISLRPNSSQAIVITDDKIAEEYSRQFDVMWGLASE